MRLIADGTVDRESVSGLAARLGYTTRQLERLLQAEVGATPLALARAQRAQTARVLIESTGLRFGDVAFAAGFSSIRQFNDTVRAIFDVTPTDLRRRACDEPAGLTTASTLSLRLPVREPFGYRGLFGHLAATAIPGCEEVRNDAYRRVLRLPHGTGIVSLMPAADHVGCLLTLDDLRDVTVATARCRRLLDIDADPQAIDAALGSDDTLGHLVRKSPGQRIPRTVDECELAMRVVLGQQVSTKAAAHLGRQLVTTYGPTVRDVGGGLTHAFPHAAELAEQDLNQLPMPSARSRSFAALIRALTKRELTLDPGADWNEVRTRLVAMPGTGVWTAELIAMRGLGDPDAFPANDLGVRVAARQLGLSSSVAALTAFSARWRPWRSYATQYLWSALDHPVNHWPPREAT